MTHPATTRLAARRRRTVPGRMPGGFTLVELLVVIVVLAILAALLLPAINAAIRTAKNAAVSAEINQLAQALANFKSKYGDYPPSRVLLVENGELLVILRQHDTSSPASSSGLQSPGAGDITVGQLASPDPLGLPQVLAQGAPQHDGRRLAIASTVWYDFNGNGEHGWTPYILHGHECLVFFLGGVPLLRSGLALVTDMTGFGKDPTNPFTNPTWAIRTSNRQAPIYRVQPRAGLLVGPHDTHPSNATSGNPGLLRLAEQRAAVACGYAAREFLRLFQRLWQSATTTPTTSTSPSGRERAARSSCSIRSNFPTIATCLRRAYTALKPIHNLHHDSDGTTSGIVTYPEPPDVPDHLLGDRRALRRRRPVPVQTTAASTVPLAVRWQANTITARVTAPTDCH